MSEPKYTKGPWKVDHETKLKKGYVAISCGDHSALAEVVWLMEDHELFGENSPQCEANALLISAAPEQHEALQAYEEAFERLFAQCLSNGLFDAWGNPVDCTLLNEAHYKGERAIKKALGTP